MGSLRARALVVLGLTVLGAAPACATSSGGVVVDDDRSDAGGGLLGTATGDASTADASGRDADAGKPPPDPAEACSIPVPTPSACVADAVPSPGVIGGAPPDGYYERTFINTDRLYNCPPSSLWLDRGIFRLAFYDLGLVSIRGGTFTVDSKGKELVMKEACAEPSGGAPLHEQTYGYAFVPETETMSLFYGGAEWIYARRKNKTPP